MARVLKGFHSFTYTVHTHTFIGNRNELRRVWPDELEQSAAATEVCFIDTAAVLRPTQNCTVFS